MTLVRNMGVAALALWLGTSNVFATATANFAPVGSTSVLAGTPIDADISISKGTLASFDFAFILIGTQDPVGGLSFGYDSDWSSAFATVDPPAINSGVHLGYANDILLTSDNFGAGVVNLTTIALGTVQIDTTGMLPGVYDIRISNATDGSSELVLDGEGQGLAEPIEGMMSFTILPEPATALMMLIGGISLLRRLKK